MGNRSAPSFTWIAAPVGWWFRGAFGRKLAHIWPGADGTWRGTCLPVEDALDPLEFHSEEAAMAYYSDLLSPPPKKK